MIIINGRFFNIKNIVTMTEVECSYVIETASISSYYTPKAWFYINENIKVEIYGMTFPADVNDEKKEEEYMDKAKEESIKLWNELQEAWGKLIKEIDNGKYSK